MNRNYLFLVFFFCSFSFLHAQNSNTQSDPKIEFILLEMSIEEGNENVQLVKHMIKDGWLKREPSTKRINEAHLLCSFLDKEGNTLKVMSIENPLHKHIEYADEDQQLRRVEVEVEQEVFQLRLRYNENHHKLKIEKVNAQQQVEKELAVFHIRK